MNQSTNPIARSDKLSELRAMFVEGGVFAALGQIFQINLIVDANIVIADLRWLVLKRTNPDARPHLLEVLQARTIKAFAPTFLEEEIKGHLAVLAAEENLPVEELEAHWTTYKALISFVDVGGPETGYQDPKDVPYLKLQARLDALILSADPDIQQMGGRIAGITLVAKLCTYSREAAVEFTIKAGGAAAFTMSAALLTAAGKSLASLMPQLRKIPPWVWIACLALLAAALLHPNTRAWITSTIKSWSGRTKELGIALWEVFSPLLEEHERAKNSAGNALSEVERDLAAHI